MFTGGLLLAQSKNEFYLRRIHSLLGIIPIGAFLIVHLLVNHQATQGAEAFNKASGFMESLPFLLVVEFVLIYIPLLYHGLFGLHIAFTAKRMLDITLYSETGCSSSKEQVVFYLSSLSQCTYGKHVYKRHSSVKRLIII